MVIPTQFLPINTNRPKPTSKAAIKLDRAETSADSAKQMLNAHVVMYDKREGEDRRKRNVKTVLDTRSGRDRRFDKQRPSIDIKA